MLRRLIMSTTMALLMSLSPAVAAQDTADIAIVRADKTRLPFTVELALTPEQQEQGLMWRTKLPQGQGMLFVYERPTRRAFWMKDTLIPLDMLFFGKGGELVYIYPNATPKSLAPVGPNRKDICTVLEIAGGEATRLGIKTGDKLHYSQTKPCE